MASTRRRDSTTTTPNRRIRRDAHPSTSQHPTHPETDDGHDYLPHSHILLLAAEMDTNTLTAEEESAGYEWWSTDKVDGLKEEKRESRIAYVGVCSLTSREMAQRLQAAHRKELKLALSNMDLWRMKIMGRLYYHMELETQEQKMIESLGEHGVLPMDLVPALMTTHTVANPEYDPTQARSHSESDDVPTPTTPITPNPNRGYQTTAQVLQDTTTSIPGVSTTLSSADENVTLDIRWTVLCDLFLILIADSVYDARSRVLLEEVAMKLGLGWVDVVRFESRVTEALEIQEDVERMENEDIIEGRKKSAKKKRYVMLGLATLGGGLVIGLSAGLLAPVIGAGLGAAFTTIGITGTTGFLAGAGGAAVITTGGVLTGSGIAVKGMIKRTQQVRTFNLLPLHNNKRVNCIITVPGFLNGVQDDPRLPFSVLDPIVGDVFSVLWEPEMIRETGSALSILTGEVLTQLGTTVLQATVMTALMSALQWPIVLTKLGYLIDNPWNNALDRARAAGAVLADVLIQRHLGVRPITLIGFSLGARVIFYALIELAKQKAFGIVQDVFILGATLSVSQQMWLQTRSVVSGRYVNAFARNDWVLNYLFRATSGGVGTVAGLRPIEGVPGLENVDVTDKIAGHMSYRTFMPLILDQLGFPVFADYFDEPENPDFEEDRIVVREEDVKQKKGWFSRKTSGTQTPVSRPPSGSPYAKKPPATADDELPPRLTPPTSPGHASTPSDPEIKIPKTAGFDFAAMKEVIGSAEKEKEKEPSAPPQVPQVRRSPSPMAGPSTPKKERVGEDEDRRPTSSPYSSPMATNDSWGDPPAPRFGYSFGASTASLAGNPFSSNAPKFGYSSPFGGDSTASLPGSGGRSFSSPPQQGGGLSFGGVDGSITSVVGVDEDPWAVPKRNGNGFGGNPWS
ncbi:DUF726-domain-containing protein [Hymenopellis radicata]|nr:DUF726-domain-containing protein [Hymenopellis radicata]